MPVKTLVPSAEESALSPAIRTCVRDLVAIVSHSASKGEPQSVKVSHVATHICKLERPEEWWPALWSRKLGLHGG